MDGILVTIFLGFWSILGSKLGRKPEPRSTQKGIEKRCKKEAQRDCRKSRNKNLQRCGAEGVQFTCGNKVTQGSKGYPCDLMIWARWRSGLRPYLIDLMIWRQFRSTLEVGPFERVPLWSYDLTTILEKKGLPTLFDRPYIKRWLYLGSWTLFWHQRAL